jgi:epoxyqueuosine reductase QueG
MPTGLPNPLSLECQVLHGARSGSRYAAREPSGSNDTRALAREVLAMRQEEFSRTVSNSPMKRAKLRGLKRNAAVVLGGVVTVDDIDVLTPVAGATARPAHRSRRRCAPYSA